MSVVLPKGKNQPPHADLGHSVFLTGIFVDGLTELLQGVGHLCRVLWNAFEFSHKILL